MKIKPIRTKRDYKSAVKRIEELWDTDRATAAADELEVLATLVNAYEKQHFPISQPDPIAAILFRMEQMGLTKTDLAPCFGGKNRVSEVLNRRRKLTVRMIRTLHNKLDIPAGILIGEVAQ
ncbi:MAG: transcriptional regulator [Candidatus Lindowbacteria bacterium]|nr:transcriptional regulator [Candidatus Lindowbacteria bacterium]